jgi:protein-disulfide isomerase
MRPLTRVLVLALGLLGCDDEKVDVVGLERRVELLEQQQREAAEARGKLDTQLADEAEARGVLQAELATANDALASLQGRLDQLEAAADKKLEPSKLFGRPTTGARYKVDLGDAHTRGNAEAKVTIVMFSDFQCPFCKRVMVTIGELETEYGKDLRFAMKHNPLPMHNRARAAALAAEAAGKQGKFWEMHDLLYENARDLTDANFTKWAKDLKLDVGRFERDLDDAKLADKVDDDQAQSKTLGATGTPAFFINGRYMAGAQPIDNFKKLVDEEIAEADKLLAAGTPGSSLYERIIASGLEKPE